MNEPIKNELIRRVIDISYKLKLSHIGSCLTSLGIIERIYESKKHDEPFILSNGHAALALYVMIEKYYFKNAEDLFLKYGTHPVMSLKDKIYCSTGSLGQGITVAVGMALADRTKNVFVLLSDGECAEGSVWEALRIAGEQRLENLKVAVNANGLSAYSLVDVDLLDSRLQLFYPTLVVKTNLNQFPEYLNGLEGHYHKLSKEEYEEITK
jgi:transketolase